PDRLVRIWEVSPKGDDHNVASLGNYTSWREQAKSFTAMGAHMAPFGVTLVADGEAAHIVTADVTPSVMQTLGARAALGRTFAPQDERGGGRLIVLSHEFWTRRFSADLDVVGRTLVVNEVPS